MHPLHHAVVEPLHQQVEFAAEQRDHAFLVGAVIDRERHTPDLVALFLAQIVEELGEPGDQVGLGEHHIDR